MNPIFWIVVILFCVLIWFLLAFLFKPIGKIFYRIWKDAIDEMKEEGEHQ